MFKTDTFKIVNTSASHIPHGDYPIKYVIEAHTNWQGIVDIQNRLTTPEQNFNIKHVIFNYPATIVYWDDGTKTVVKCCDDDTYDPEKGLAMCFMKRALENNENHHKVLKKWVVPEVEIEESAMQAVTENIKEDAFNFGCQLRKAIVKAFNISEGE